MINGKLLFVIGLQIIFVYGQPIFTPMAGQFGLPLDTLGAATGYAGGGAGFPLLSPMELNAIMAAQVRGGNFKSAFTPDTEPQGYSGYSGFAGNNNGFMPNFEEGFSNDGNSEFYEAPQHGEPFPVQEAEPQMKKPEPKGRDNRGRYHKDDASEGPVEGEHSEGPQEPRHEQNPRHHQEHRESGPSNGQSRQRGAYREEERESAEPNYNEPASGGAYREYRGSSGPSSSADASEGSDGPDGPGSPGSPGSPEPYSGGQERETYRDEAPSEHFRDNARLRHNH